MAEKHFSINIKAEGSIAIIEISDRISKWDITNAIEIKKKIQEFIARGIINAEVHLNTIGGDVFEGNEINNSFKLFKNVKIKGGALVASAGSYILCGYKNAVKRNTQIMIHEPSASFYGNVDEIRAQTKLLENLSADYARVYSEKTGKTAEEIKNLYAKGDFWMNAEEAKNLGFVDEIEEDDAEITAEMSEYIFACGGPKIMPKINADSINNQNIEMDKNFKLMVIAALALAADATDDQVIAKINDLNMKAKDIDQIKAQADQIAKSRAEKLVAQAEADKKITASQKEFYLKNAISDFDGTEKAIADMVAPQAVSGQLGKKKPTSSTGDQSDWNLNDFIEKDPQALAMMEDEDPERFKSLNDAYYGKK